MPPVRLRLHPRCETFGLTNIGYMHSRSSRRETALAPAGAGFFGRAKAVETLTAQDRFATAHGRLWPSCCAPPCPISAALVCFPTVPEVMPLLG
jgi:hypothetical protein